MIRRYALIELNEPKTREIAEGLFLCDNTHQYTLSEHSSEAGIAHVALHLTVSNIPRKRNLMPDEGSGTFTRNVQGGKNLLYHPVPVRIDPGRKPPCAYGAKS
jgi:hypothetical protein